MMKKLFAVILVAFIALPVFSQIKFGLKAGISTTSMTMESLKTISSTRASYSVEGLTQNKYGFHGGAFLRLSLLGVYVQPELLFSTRSNEYTVTNTMTAASYVVKQSFNKLDIPVMLGVKFGPVRINAGPAASFLINTPKALIADQDFESAYNKMSFGYQAGVGLDILSILTIDLRYEGSLSKYQNQIKSMTGTKVNLDDRPNSFLFSVGLMF